MPVLMSPEIANKFKEKWMTIHPDEQDNISGSVHFDDSLTSLHWLQNFSILSDTQGKFPSSGCHPQHLFYSRSQLGGHDSPSSPPAGDTAASGMPQTPGNPTTSCSGMLNQYGQHITVPANPPEDIDYKTNRYVKPPYSYATLICMAMRASNKTKVTLSAIYSWITENFCYYRYAEPSWQNSIRHNLSLNKCFMKVPRQKDEPGKGGFWQIDPQYADMFVNGVFKRRRMPAANFNTHRQSKQLSSRSSHAILTDQPITGLFQECLPGSKRKQIHPKRSGKLAKISKSPLLTEFHASDILRGDFDLSSVIDDVLSGNDSTFEDLDINNALSSLGCGSEPSQGQHALGYSEDVKACAYIEANSMMECKMEDFTQHHLYQDQAHPQYYEGMILFPDQAQQHHLHSWEIKEEVQAIPITMDDGYGVCEGFYSEMQHYTHY